LPLAFGAVGDRAFGRPESREKRLDAVVILLRDRVELVVVAAGAPDRDAEEDLRCGVGDVVEDFLPALLQIDCVILVWVVAQKAGGDPRVGVVGVAFVAGNLLGEEAVVGLIVIERLNDVIAVAPGVGPGVVCLE